MKTFLTFLLYSLSTYVFSQAPLGRVVVKTTGAKLTVAESSTSAELMKLNNGDTLTVLDVVFPSISTSPRYKSEFKGQIGYVSEYFLYPSFYSSTGEVRSISHFLEGRKKLIKAQEDSIANIKKALAAEELAKYKKRIEIDEAEQIRINDSIADAMLKKIKADNKARIENNLQERREKFIKKYGPEIGEKISKRNIWIGMTEEMLIDSWGRPEKVNNTVTRYGTRKQYVYSSSQYVYVENGMVDAWQN